MHDCPNCQRQEQRIQELLVDLQNVQVDVLGKNRQISALKRELKASRELAPDAQEVQRLLEYWVRALGKKKSTKIPLDGARAQRVRWVLKTYGEDAPERFKRATDGMARFPYRGPFGKRSSVLEKGYKLDDDITLYCRNESTFERFEKYGMDPIEAKLELERLRILDQLRSTGASLIEICDALDIRAAELRDVWKTYGQAAA